jgi:hypothetical protein
VTYQRVKSPIRIGAPGGEEGSGRLAPPSSPSIASTASLGTPTTPLILARAYFHYCIRTRRAYASRLCSDLPSTPGFLVRSPAQKNAVLLAKNHFSLDLDRISVLVPTAPPPRLLGHWRRLGLRLGTLGRFQDPVRDATTFCSSRYADLRYTSANTTGAPPSAWSELGLQRRYRSGPCSPLERPVCYERITRTYRRQVSASALML